MRSNKITQVHTEFDSRLQTSNAVLLLYELNTLTCVNSDRINDYTSFFHHIFDPIPNWHTL